jgi:positive regulator of sigma E activity
MPKWIVPLVILFVVVAVLGFVLKLVGWIIGAVLVVGVVGWLVVGKAAKKDG